MPMEGMCSCQLHEAPLERPHSNPFLRSMSLEFGSTLECWGPSWGAELQEPSAQSPWNVGRDIWWEIENIGECYKIQISTDTKR